MKQILFFLVCHIFLVSSQGSHSNNQTYLPVVLYHGMGDTSDGSINPIKDYLEKQLPGIYVTSIRMGKSFEDDLISSYFMNINDQIVAACLMIMNDPNLRQGYNGIGFSQGGQIMRGIAQRCPQPQMVNLISLGGQHQGIYGLPRCPGENKTLCDLARKLLNYGAYLDFVQQHSTQAEYWHDPLQEELYKQKSVFLADINNEKLPRNQDYKQRIMNLKNMVLVRFLNDSIVDPGITELFGFYHPGQAKEVYTVRQSQLYNEDWLGLKQLDQRGGLSLIEIPGDHLEFNMTWFKSAIVDKFLS